MSKHIHIYDIDSLTEDKIVEKLKEFYTKNTKEPKEISLTIQAYNAVYPYHKQQVRSIRHVPVTITADRIAPLVTIS